eukprot:1160436-Pelagomonas_calceolata.AAC.16
MDLGGTWTAPVCAGALEESVPRLHAPSEADESAHPRVMTAVAAAQSIPSCCRPGKRENPSTAAHFSRSCWEATTIPTS